MCSSLEQLREKPSIQRIVSGGNSRVLGDDAYDEELIVDDTVVIWAAAGRVKNKLTAKEPILQATWSYFENTGTDAIICLLHGTKLSVHTCDGDSHSVPLPGSAVRAWPLPQGLLVELTSGTAMLLQHPLEPLQQIEAIGPWQGEQIVWSSTEAPILVSYSAEQERLSIWVISIHNNTEMLQDKRKPVVWPTDTLEMAFTPEKKQGGQR